MPNPQSVAFATGAMWEKWRKSSRAKILLMCTSITGMFTAATASRIATEEWV